MLSARLYPVCRDLFTMGYAGIGSGNQSGIGLSPDQQM